MAPHRSARLTARLRSILTSVPSALKCRRKCHGEPKTFRPSNLPGEPFRPLDLPGEPFRLLDLPGELRNQIYTYAIYHPDGVAIDLSGPRPTGGRNARALNMTCKQIRDEVGNLLFDLNTIAFSVPLFDCYYGATYGQKSEVMRPFRELLRTFESKHQLRMVHVHLGRQKEHDYDIASFFRAIRAVDGPIHGLLGNGRRVRVSFDLRIKEGVVAEFDFRLDSPEVAQEDLGANIDAALRSRRVSALAACELRFLKSTLEQVFFD